MNISFYNRPKDDVDNDVWRSARGERPRVHVVPSGQCPSWVVGALADPTVARLVVVNTDGSETRYTTCYGRVGTYA